MQKIRGETLKSEIAFQEEDAHEIHTDHIAKGPVFSVFFGYRTVSCGKPLLL